MNLVENPLEEYSEDYDFDNITTKYFTDEALSQESVCATDERVKQIETLTLPYKAICKLYMKAADGKNYIGTGFLTHRNKLYTAGHCVYDHDSGGWMKSIIVVPAKAGQSEPFGRYYANSLYASSEWINSKSLRFDMGAIRLSSDVSHSDMISVSIGDSSEATVCGYPADRDTGIFQYKMRDFIRKKGGRFFYQIDTFGGQSGAPLMKDGATAIGIHNYGGCENKASDLDQDFINKVEIW